ncbi:MAG: cupin domain-containing protein, partial [Bryobacterales bacterium]|nr:cupin domain-containing protein [Bryobacterales bacterium]
MNSRDLTPLESFGFLDAEQEQELKRLAGTDPDTAAALGEWEEVASSLALSVIPVAAPPGLKNRLMSKIRKQGEPKVVAPGLRIAFQQDAVWRSTPFPGVSYRSLSVDPVSGMATSILKMEPGSMYPRHKHVAPEHALILEGDCFQGSVYLQTGDYQLADGDTVHEPIRTDNGCLILVMASQHD